MLRQVLLSVIIPLVLLKDNFLMEVKIQCPLFVQKYIPKLNMKLISGFGSLSFTVTSFFT